MLFGSFFLRRLFICVTFFLSLHHQSQRVLLDLVGLHAPVLDKYPHLYLKITDSKSSKILWFPCYQLNYCKLYTHGRLWLSVQINSDIDVMRTSRSREKFSQICKLTYRRRESTWSHDSLWSPTFFMCGIMK